MAGALGLELAGPAWYFGELHDKPTIGDDLRPPEPTDIARASRLMRVGSVLGLVAGAVVHVTLSPKLFNTCSVFVSKNKEAQVDGLRMFKIEQVLKSFTGKLRGRA
jgi:hypothetical protein